MTGLKLKTLPNFPGQIVGGVGMDVEKTNGNWTVSIDYDDLAIVSPYTAKATDYVLVYDSVANNYFLVPTTQLGG
jgi:hypothetical protein